MSDQGWKCLRCGHNECDMGVMSSHPHPVVYTSANKKGLLTASIKVNAVVCTKCGHLETYVTRENLQKHTGR